MTTSQDFLAAVRGIPTHHVIQAMNSLTHGIDWQRSSKRLIASHFDKSYYSSRVQCVDLDVLAARARARAAGDRLWHEIRKAAQS